MKNIRHVQRTKYQTATGVVISEENVYYPKSKADKLSVMGSDYKCGSTYKKTSSDGTRVLIGHGVKEHTSEIFIPQKGYKLKERTFVPNKNYNPKNYVVTKRKISHLKRSK